jgi:hypothetical protein
MLSQIHHIGVEKAVVGKVEELRNCFAGTDL